MGCRKCSRAISPDLQGLGWQHRWLHQAGNFGPCNFYQHWDLELLFETTQLISSFSDVYFPSDKKKKREQEKRGKMNNSEQNTGFFSVLPRGVRAAVSCQGRVRDDRELRVPMETVDGVVPHRALECSSSPASSAARLSAISSKQEITKSDQNFKRRPRKMDQT